MKFLVIMKATADSEAGRLPTRDQIESGITFNEQLAKDGMLIAVEGLRPSSKGTRLRFDGGRPIVVDGPFAETKELIAGFWILEGKSREELVERFSHMPYRSGEIVEIREFFQPEDFAGILTPEQHERTERVTLEDLRT